MWKRGTLAVAPRVAKQSLPLPICRRGFFAVAVFHVSARSTQSQIQYGINSVKNTPATSTKKKMNNRDNHHADFRVTGSTAVSCMAFPFMFGL